MCGIFGLYSWPSCMSRAQVAKILLEGLSLLEYRGYDSAGISMSTANGDSFLFKSQGNVKKLDEKVSQNIDACNWSHIFNTGIAHTRWATHGPPSDTNSHPHVSDEDLMFQVVHNGIIANNKELRAMLESQGFTFYSQTDTEVIPKLFKFEHNKCKDISFVELTSKVVQQLEGSFALLVVSKKYPNQYMACCKGSPLLIGKGVGGLSFSSDICALVDSTHVAIMHDKTMFHANGHSQMYYDFQGHVRDSEIWVLNTTKSEDVRKGKYDTYMQKEIFEQPSSLSNTIKDYYNAEPSYHYANKLINKHVDACDVNKMAEATDIVLVGCGTSFHSCLANRTILSELLKKSVYVEVAGEFEVSGHNISPHTLYIFVSQSGETADTLEAMRYVRRTCNSAVCVAITNKPKSTIAREATYSIDLNAGMEISVASTKAYTSQLLMLIVFGLYVKRQAFGLDKNDISNYMALAQIPQHVAHTLATLDEHMLSIAHDVKKFQSILFIGRGSDYATAHEAALKVKEISYIHSEGILASELKHGPLAMIDDNVCLIVFVNRNQHYGKMVSVVEQLLARKSKIYVVCDDDDTHISKIVDEARLIRVPKQQPITQHIINIIPMQLLAYHLAVLRGNQVDQPRNLAKSVTVSD